MRKQMIKAEHLVKSFDGFFALQDLTMTVPRGAVYGLVGPNGAGKSTLIRHVTGAYRQDSGTLLVDGQPVYENPAVKARIATIPDDFYYFQSATTRDMMRFYRGIYPRFDMERYHKLKEAFALVDEGRPIRRLSKGMQKQAAFWLSLCCGAELLVLDEPVDGLDPVMRRQVWSLLLGDVAERGTTVLVSSHNLRELEDVCDHVGILSRGRLLLERSLTELQGNVVKMQVVFQEKEIPQLPEELKVLHSSQVGRIHTLIVRGTPDEVTNRLAVYNPILMDAIPLTLEEIFIYELGGEDYAVKDIVL
jgi:ABC-2 type transport system ATP-binding protein